MSLHHLDGAMPRLAYALSIGLVSLSLAAQASPPPTSPVPENSPAPITVDAGSANVQADAFAPTQAATASDVVVIQGDAITSAKARSAADLLRDAAGVYVSDYGTAGGLQSVTIRGSSSAQVLIIVDGQRMNNAQSGGFNLALLGADRIERIEVLRGGASAAYGADAVGGVIYITTRHPTKDGLSVNVENRAYLPRAYTDALGLSRTTDTEELANAQHTSIVGNFGLGAGRLTLFGASDHDLGKFIYTDDAGVIRQRDQVTTWGGNGGIGLDTPLGGGKFRLDLAGQAKRTGTPGSTTYPDPTAYQDDTNASLNLTWKTDSFINDNLNFDSHLWGDWQQLNYSSTYGSTISNLGSAGIDLKQSALVADILSLDYGISGRYDGVTATGMVNLQGNQPYRLSGGVYVNPIVKTGILTLSPSVRLDLFSDTPAGLTATASADLALSEITNLWLSLARSYRAPTFNELYWPADAYSQGNSNLRPESAWSGDLGVAFKSEIFSSRSALFVRYVQDGITWDLSGPKAIPANITAAFYPGFDQDFSLSYQWFRAGLNYEFLHSYDLDSGYTFASDKRVKTIPDHKLSLRAGMRLGGFELNVNGQLNGQGFWDATNTQIMYAYFVLNANVAYWFSDVSNIYLAVDNLLNQSYQTNQGFPMPGIGLRIGMNLGF